MAIGLGHRRALFAGCLCASLAVALLVGCASRVAPLDIVEVDDLEAGDFETYPVAKPFHASQTWEQRKSVFGWRVHEAFGIPLRRAHEFAGWILEAADRQRLAPELIASLVFTESSFRKQVRSPAGAIGPAQIKPRYWARFCGVRDLRDPEQNIYCGAQVLAHLEERCGGLACALASYNVGFNAWQRQAGLRYVSRIERHRSKFDRI
ncbi:MAG: lytic transglycosylase domain-containing protein [Gammaproteobacteria bacterium]|nr:lytic transglycosylase domain-containing protein [Gammaproteobacteria bacterium]MYE51382.1 lytic transglycosylase domain-containing protein [Gammaproteobacteria bacterium]